MLSPEFEQALDMIQEVTSDLSFSSLYGLSDLGQEERERLVEVWSHVELPQRRRIVQALIEITDASFLVDFGALFRLCLVDEDAEVRALAVHGLWEDHDWNLASTLIRLLREDPVPEVRATAAAGLSDFVLQGELQDRAQARAARVRDALLDALDPVREPLEVRRRALESLAYASDSRVTALIGAAYDDDECAMRVSALFAMGRSADPVWAPMVLQELDNSEAEIRYEATRACGELQLAQAVPPLEALTQDPDREVKETAIWALGQIGGPEARRVLEACYEYGDESIREAVEEALANMDLIRESFDLAYHELLDEELQDLEDLENGCLREQGEQRESGQHSP
jgi:HEAT repeat protein